MYFLKFYFNINTLELHGDTISQRYVSIQIKRQWNKAYATV